jgi:Zn finger protein HypA/HybF involved in hydrogenase expression
MGETRITGRDKQIRKLLVSLGLNLSFWREAIGPFVGGTMRTECQNGKVRLIAEKDGTLSDLVGQPNVELHKRFVECPGCHHSHLEIRPGKVTRVIELGLVR